MKRVLLLAGFLIVAITALVIGVRVVGARQISPFNPLFTSPDGAPCPDLCLLGARPGITRYVEAYRLVQTHPLFKGQFFAERNTLQTTELLGPHVMVSLVSDDSGTLEAISLTFTPESATLMTQNSIPATLENGIAALGDALVHLGTPGFVQAWPSTRSPVRVMFPDHSMVLTSFTSTQRRINALAVDDPVRFIGLGTPEWFDRAWQEPMKTAMRWGGLRRLDRYYPSTQ